MLDAYTLIAIGLVLYQVSRLVDSVTRLIHEIKH